MKLRNAVLFFLMPLSFVLGAVDEWPRKGDTVYVAASFMKLTSPSPVAGSQRSYDMPPCRAFVIMKANPRKSKWVAKDPVGGTEILEGGWLSRMHRAKAACQAQLEKDGEPVFTRSGSTFKLTEPAAK